MVEHLTRLMVASGATWVLWVLFALSLGSAAVALERVWVFRRSRGEVATLVAPLRKLLRAGDVDGAAKLLAAQPCVESRVVAAGLAEADGGPEAAEEAMAAALGLERQRLESRLLFLGTVGNNAPFVGLLGTVIGVVGAFDALGKPVAVEQAASAMAPEHVMATIAEALVATAVGLVVAIPAVAVFNYFQGKVAAAVADAETLGHVLLAHLRARGEPERRLPQPAAAAQAPSGADPRLAQSLAE